MASMIRAELVCGGDEGIDIKEGTPPSSSAQVRSMFWRAGGDKPKAMEGKTASQPEAEQTEPEGSSRRPTAPFLPIPLEIREEEATSLYWRAGGGPPRTLGGKTENQLQAENEALKKERKERKKEDLDAALRRELEASIMGGGEQRSIGSATPIAQKDYLFASPIPSPITSDQPMAW